MTASCKNCTERVVGCHVDCRRYAMDKVTLRMIKEQRRIERIGNDQEIERFLRRRKNVQDIRRRRQGY